MLPEFGVNLDRRFGVNSVFSPDACCLSSVYILCVFVFKRVVHTRTTLVIRTDCKL